MDEVRRKEIHRDGSDGRDKKVRLLKLLNVNFFLRTFFAKPLQLKLQILKLY